MLTNLNPENKEKATHNQVKQQIEAIKEYLKDNPKDYSKMFALAQRYFIVHQYRNCSEICHKLKKLGAEQSDVYRLGIKADISSGYYKDAIDIGFAGLERFPENYELLVDIATALNNDGRLEEGEAYYKKAVELRPEDPVAYVNIGNYYLKSGDLEKALNIYHDGLKKFPTSPDILNNIGSVYTKIDNYVKASEYYIACLRLDPERPQSLINLGAAMDKLQNAFVSIQFYDEALRLDPKNPVALCSKAYAMSNSGLAQESMPLFSEGLELMRDSNEDELTYRVNFSNYIFSQHYVPSRSVDQIFEDIKYYNNEICGDITEKPALDFENTPEKTKKLKVGLLSKGFSVHPVGQMIYSGLENLDKDKFELYCYSDNLPKSIDMLTEKLYALMHKVTNVNNVLNHTVVEKMRDDEIDILIEMTGHSEGGRRLPLVAERAAPVQVKWVGGLFNTSGVPQMDWLISDDIETPEGVDDRYTEKIYRMPDDYIVYYPPEYAPDVLDLPAQKNGYVTFGNLNNLSKTNSYSIQVWSKILHMVPNSKMLLKGNKMHEEFVQEHLYSAFESHGITRDRVIIEGGEKHKMFMDVYNRIDICLDPHPYTGGLTTCEALWMGVPVVTLPGDTFASRHSASHLTNAKLEHLVAKDEQDYIDIAVKLAGDVDELSKIRNGLRDHVSKTPLVDGPRFAKNLEKALYHMWGEWCDLKVKADQPKEVSAPKPKKSKKKK